MKRTLPMRMMNAALGFLMKSSVASVCIKREANLKDSLVRLLCWAKGFKPWIIKCQQSSYYHNNDNKLLFLFVLLLLLLLLLVSFLILADRWPYWPTSFEYYAFILQKCTKTNDSMWKLVPKTFRLNSHTTGFRPQTQKLKPVNKTHPRREKVKRFK